MSREDVIRQIVQREVQQLGLTAETVSKEVPELHEVACDHFGFWEIALRYAGVTVREAQRREQYSPDRVLQKIRTLCITGYDLRASRNSRRDRELYDAARKHFGTWRKALQAVGINLANAFVRSIRKLKKEQLLEWIKQREAGGASLTWSDVCLENRSFAAAVKYKFGSWRRALIAAGIDPDLWRKSPFAQWDQQRVIECIRERQQSGQSLKCADVRRDHRPLARAAQRCFGSWREAMRAAGVGME